MQWPSLPFLPLVEPAHHILVSLCPVPCVHIHGQGVQLSEGSHGAQEDHYQPPSLHRLHRTCKEVWSEGLKVLRTGGGRAHSSQLHVPLIPIYFVMSTSCVFVKCVVGIPSPAEHTCRRCCPESCGSRNSNSSGCQWLQQRARRGHPASGQEFHSSAFSAADASASFGDCACACVCVQIENAVIYFVVYKYR